MISFPLLAISLGLVHCFEADHVLAVASISSKKVKYKSLFLEGASWGVGHSIPIIIIGISYSITKFFLLQNVSFSLELIVGVLLIVAGSYKMIKKPTLHVKENQVKAMLMVGILHGLAGSAAVILAYANQEETIIQSINYFLCFSIGSILGMGGINLVLGEIQNATKYIKKIQWLIPILTIGYGVYMIYKFY